MNSRGSVVVVPLNIMQSCMFNPPSCVFVLLVQRAAWLVCFYEWGGARTVDGQMYTNLYKFDGVFKAEVVYFLF